MNAYIYRYCLYVNTYLLITDDFLNWKNKHEQTITNFTSKH